jgi:hypothetical protein
MYIEYLASRQSLTELMRKGENALVTDGAAVNNGEVHKAQLVPRANLTDWIHARDAPILA